LYEITYSINLIKILMIVVSDYVNENNRGKLKSEISGSYVYSTLKCESNEIYVIANN